MGEGDERQFEKDPHLTSPRGRGISMLGLSQRERDDFKKLVDMYLSIMIVMINDALQHRQLDDEQYNSYLRMIEAHKPGKLLQIFVDAGDKATRNAERKLLFDAISYEIISYI